MAVNCLNLVQNHIEPFRPPLRTIEFRQHRGTVDPELITFWVSLRGCLRNFSLKRKVLLAHA